MNCDLEFINESGHECPPYSALRVRGSRQLESTGWRVFLEIEKPNGDTIQSIFFNTNQTVPNGEYGKCTRCFPVYAAYSGSTPSNGDRFGIHANSWTLASDVAGAYAVIDVADDGPNGEPLVLVSALDGAPDCGVPLFDAFGDQGDDILNADITEHKMTRGCGWEYVTGSGHIKFFAAGTMSVGNISTLTATTVITRPNPFPSPFRADAYRPMVTSIAGHFGTTAVGQATVATLFFRYIDANNMWYVKLTANEDGSDATFEIRKIVAGVNSSVFSESVGFPIGVDVYPGDPFFIQSVDWRSGATFFISTGGHTYTPDPIMYSVGTSATVVGVGFGAEVSSGYANETMSFNEFSFYGVP